MVIDLNCDMGESFGRYTLGHDLEIMPYISSCNVACGFHAGDPRVIIETIQNAITHNVKIGAHPSYPDLQGFGRRKMQIPHEELVALLQYQIAAIQRLSEIYGGQLHHVKPHGALYNHAYENETAAQAIVDAMKPWKDSLILYAQFNSVLEEKAKSAGQKVWSEGFADRKYGSSLNLLSRSLPDAVHSSIELMTTQVIKMIKENVISTDRGDQKISVQTICFHGDHPSALEIVKSIRASLEAEGITLR